MCAQSHSTSPPWRMIPTKQFSVGDEAVFQAARSRPEMPQWFRVLPSELAMAYGGRGLSGLKSSELFGGVGGGKGPEGTKPGGSPEKPPHPPPAPTPDPRAPQPPG